MFKYSDVLKKQKKDEEKSTSSAVRAGSAAASRSGTVESKNDFMERVRKETRNLYRQQSRPSGTPAPTAPNLYAAAAQRMTPGLTGAQRQMIAERTPETPNLYSQAAQRMTTTGDTWEDTQALGRELTPRMTYSQFLAQNMDTAASGGEVTPQMQAELQRAEQADREYKERKRQQERRWVEQQMAAQGNLYTPQPERTPTPGLTGAQRQMIAERGEAISENAPLAEVKARLPGLKGTYDTARQNYQQIMDRNMRLANETGAVPPEMVAELYRAEQARNQAEQRYNAALARNEELSYAEKMGEVKTDLSGIAQLLDDRARFEAEAGMQRASGMNDLAADFDRQRAEADAKIEAVREQLRLEGYSDKEIQALFEYQVKLKNAAEMQERTERYRTEAAGNSDFENWLLNTSTGLAGGIGYLDLAGQWIQGKISGADPITGQTRVLDYNTGAQAPHAISEATMQGEMDKLLEQYGERDENGNLTGDMERMGRIRAGAYQLSVSMGQSAAVAGLTAIGAPCAMLLLSGNAATQTAHEMHEAGYSDGDALLMGAISGAAEYVTEKIGMDKLFETRDLSTAKNVVQTLLGNIVNQSMAEGGEEVLSTVINTLADLLVNRDKSELALRYRELLAQGMTPEEAERAAAREWMQGAWQDFYMGALSGGLFGMGGTAFVSGRNAITDARTGRQIIDAGTVQDVLDAAKKLDGKISDAAAMPEISDTPSARELGAAQRGLERAQVMENMRAELESRGEENVSPALLSALYNSSLEQEQRLTREEQKALRGSRTAMELAAEWREQRGDNSVPAPFEGMEDILRRQMEEKENVPQEGATEEGAINGEQTGEAGPYAASENGDDGVRAGEQVRLPGEGEGAQPGGQGEVRQGVSESRGENLRSVTLRELGVTDAAEGATIQVQDENSLTGDAASAAQQVRQIGLEPVAFRGDMIINGASVNGYIQNGKVFFRTDAKYRDGTPIPPDAIVRHESVHNAKDADPGIIDTGMEIVRQKRSETEVQAMKDAYRETYKDLYDFEKMSEEEITDMLVEEIVADAYGGLNYFRDGGETVEQVRGAIGSRVESAQNVEAGAETRGPPRALAAGERARNRIKSDLDLAKEMLAVGMSPDGVRLETGWYQGADGKWRFEIDDSNMKLRGDPSEIWENTDPADGIYLVDLIQHKELFEQYPFLKNVRVDFFTRANSGTNGQWNGRFGTISLNEKYLDGFHEEMLDTLVHEIQHAVQQYEGFSGGSSPGYWINRARNGMASDYSKSRETSDAEQQYSRILEQAQPEVRDLIRRLNQAYAENDLDAVDEIEGELFDKYADAFEEIRHAEMSVKDARENDRKRWAAEMYWNTAGEIEARDAAARRNMTAEERKNTPPDLGDENTVFAEGPETSYALRDKKIPTREELEAKAPIVVVDIREKANKSRHDQRTDIRTDEDMKKLMSEPVVNDDTEEPLFITGRSVTHSLSNKGQEQISMIRKLREVLKHAVLTHSEQSRTADNDHTTGVYKLFGAVRTEDGIQPVKITVKEYNVAGQSIPENVKSYLEQHKENDTYATVYDGKVLVVEGIEKEASGSARASQDVNPNADTYPLASNISVAHLLDLVKGEDQKYIPQKAGPRASAEVDSRRSLEQQLQELKDAYQAASDRNDTEFDYRGTLQKITELEKRVGENAPLQTAQSAASSPEGAPSAENMDAARADLLDVGEATVRNDTGTYIMKVRKKGDRYQAQIFKNGKLDKSQSFPSAQEAADYAVDWVKGRTEGQTDAELDNERSEQREKPGPHWPTGKEYGEEIVRQKQNKAADAATQTLRERIRRAEAELQALRRLDRNTGLTDRQKARMNDIQETLDIMNDELTARKGRRAEKKNRAKQTPVTENKPTRSAAEAKNALMDLFHTAAGNRAEVGRQIESKLAEIAQSGRITEEGRQQLYDMLMDNGMVPKHAEETFREIRNWLRGTRIFVNEQERADLGDNFEDLRKRAWGAGIYLTNDLRDGRIDAINGQMADTFGENRFPTDNALSDMLENMIDLADKGKTTQQTMQEAVEGEARETGKSANEIYADMFNQMDETLRTFAEKAGLEVDLKNRTATQLAQERQRWEDRMERKAQARRESEIRGKVLRGLQRLSKLRGKAGPEIRADIDEVLADIDTQARQITPAGLENLQDLQRAYEEAREKAGYVDKNNMGNWIPNPYVEEKLASLTKKHVNDMSLEEVVDLGRTVEALEHAIRTQNQMIGEEFDATIEESANGVRGDVESSKGAKPGFLHKWLKEEHLSPRRFLDMLGGWTDGTMSKLSKSLEDGQTRMLDFQRRATQSFDPFLSKKANRQWLEKASGKKAEWTKYTVLDGYSEDGGSYTEIELTPMMKISLYLQSRNMDNLRHIQTGGIKIPNKELYLKGDIKEAYARGKRVRMNPETVRSFEKELTDTERTFANHMITFFDQISKDAINEVSLQLDGFERAGVENYMPIETDPAYIAGDVAAIAKAQTVEGIGSIANERIHASNPILLDDASSVLMRQIDRVSRYYGYAIPIRNFQAVNNYVFHEEGTPFSTSIKEIVNKKWGSGAEQYITKMLEDLQTGGIQKSDMLSRGLRTLRGNLAGATLMFNPSVAVSQTASYPGAAQAVGWDGLAHGLVAGRVDPKLIEKYSPLYWYRNQGNSTQELGDYMSQKGLEQKLPWIMNWIQQMDSATIRRLWAASEYRVSKDNPGLKPGSQADIDAGKDAYYQKVAEVFNRAVYDTQPNYTNMERAQILRSNSEVTKFLSMYKTVPLQYYGMMVEATGRLQAAVKSGDQTRIAEARKYAANTFGGLLAANTVYVAMKALFKGIRRKDKDYRDEEGNLTAGSVAAQLGKDLAETYAGSIIGGAEAFSAAKTLLTGSKFYGPEMSALSYVEDMVGAVNSVFKSIGDEDPRKAAGAIKDAAVTLAQGFGVPAKNMETYLMAAVRWTFPAVAMEYDNLFGGIERADLKGMDEQAVSTATNLILQNRTGLKIDQSVTDELARLYAAGENAAVPTETPSSFTYNGKTVEISDRGAYSDTWGAIVGDNLEELVTADDYVSADDGQRAALVNKLYQYATVEARREADPEYSAEGNSTYGWTVKADEAVEAGVGLVDAICALDAFGHMTADKDEFGNSISGSKKAKVCAYIDAMDITDEQKDVMYLLSGYKENSLEYTPWHGWDEDEEDGSGSGSGEGSGSEKGSGSGKRSGGKRSGGRGGSRKAAPKEKAVKGSGGKIQLPKAARTGGSGSGKAEGLGKGADASLSLIEIIDRYYGGNALAAAMDGGARARGRTTVDFEV